MVNRPWTFALALVLAGAQIRRCWLLSRRWTRAAGGGGPVGGIAVGVTPGAAAASIKRSNRKPQQHQVAAPQGTRQPVVISRKPVVRSH